MAIGVRRPVQIVLVVALLGLSATQAQAQVWTTCRDRIHTAHHRLELAIANYGNFSRQAGVRQNEFNRVRAWCWQQYRGWWDDRYGRWRTDRW